MRRVRCLGLVAIALPLLAAAPEQAARERAQTRSAAAAQDSERLAAAARAADAEADLSRAQAVALAAKIQAGEQRIAGAHVRIAQIEALRARQRQALAARQAPAARLAAALETMARRPAALALAQPGSLRDMVHTRLLLASTLPQIEAKSGALQSELARGTRLRKAADQALARLHAEQASLARDRAALDRLEAMQRQRQDGYERAALLSAERAQGYAEQARDLGGLIARLDADAATAARLASLPGPIARPLRPGQEQQPPAPPQFMPAGMPDWGLPLAGRLITGMGELSASGVRAQGLTLAPTPGALAVAPAAGTVRFAGPFRGYGTILILDHGGGWTTLLTGLGRTRAQVGDRLAKGSPLGSAPATLPRVTVELRHDGRPVDIARLAVRP